MLTMKTLEQIARICHEANRAYCQSLGDYSQIEWTHAPDWQKESVINGVLAHALNPDIDPAANHQMWLEGKLADGWKYGETKDIVAKTHPCCVPYADLPEEQKMKDHIFAAICKAMLAEVLK